MSIRMTKIKKAENIKCWQRRGVAVILVHCWWQSVTTLKKDLFVCVFFPKKLNINLFYDQQYDSWLFIQEK